MPKHTRKDKAELTSQLVKQLGDANVLYLTDFTGLGVKSMTDLRRRFREAGTRYLVVKNRLALRALEEIELPEIASYLRGPTGFVIGREDPVVPAKTLWEFAKEHEKRPTVKVGVINNLIVSAEEILQLAQLPSREALLASIAGSLTASVSGIVGVLDGMMRDIASLVEEVAKKRAGGASQVSDPDRDPSGSQV